MGLLSAFSDAHEPHTALPRMPAGNKTSYQAKQSGPDKPGRCSAANVRTKNDRIYRRRNNAPVVGSAERVDSIKRASAMEYQPVQPTPTTDQVVHVSYLPQINPSVFH